MEKIASIIAVEAESFCLALIVKDVVCLCRIPLSALIFIPLTDCDVPLLSSLAQRQRGRVHQGSGYLASGCT